MEEEKKEGVKQETNQCKSHKAFIIVILVIAMGISFGCGFMFSEKMRENDKPKESQKVDKPEEKPELVNTPLVDNEPVPEGYDAYSFTGKATVRGYVRTQKVPSGDVVSDNPTTYDMVFFNVTESDNNKFLAFLSAFDGNTYAGEKTFSIGCVREGKLTHYNDSDETGMKEYALNQEDTNLIMNSTSSKPITLEIERLKFTGGSGAPDCYSYISTITVKK